MKKAPDQEKRGRGRPREFDRGVALERAMEVFWSHGYEGASIADLTQAMGISTPALYGAFGSKAELYREALELYQVQQSQEAWKKIEGERTTRSAISLLLRESARTFTDPRHPPGCMVSTAVLSCAEENRPIARLTAAIRQATLERIQARLQRGIDEGELPATADAAALARFFGAIIQGMSIQATDGARREELLLIAEFALSHLPGTRAERA